MLTLLSSLRRFLLLLRMNDRVRKNKPPNFILFIVLWDGIYYCSISCFVSFKGRAIESGKTFLEIV